MTVDMNSADSIRAWIAVRPAEHLAMLRTMWRQWPRFRAAIEAAVAGCA